MKKALKIVLNVLAWMILILAFLVTVIVFSSDRNGGTPNILGYMPLTVETDSMKDTFSAGDLIITKEIDDLYDLKVDDVITYDTIILGQRAKNTHRIVAINETENSRSFITKGDNNSINDEDPVYSSAIIGKWTGVKIKGLGKFMDFLRTKKGFFICILIPMAIFFLFELYKFIAVVMEMKHPALSEEEEEKIKRQAIEEYLASHGGDKDEDTKPEDVNSEDNKPADNRSSEAEGDGNKEE